MKQNGNMNAGQEKQQNITGGIKQIQNTAGTLIIQMTRPIRPGRKNQTNGDYMI